MTDGRLFLGMVTLVCTASFINGLRFARKTSNPWVGKTFLGMPVAGTEMSIARIRLIGWLQMIGAPIMLIFITAICCGLLGPQPNIKIIQL